MSQLVQILGPIGIITLIGFAMGRSSMSLNTRTLSTVIILVATPALIFNTLISMHVTVSELGKMAVAAVLAIFLSGVMGYLCLRAVGGPIRAFLPSLALPNSGNLGLPLVALTFGDEGMRLGVSYFFVVALIQHSVGLSVAAGAVNLRHLSRQPLLYAVAIVLLITVLQIPVPQMLLTTTGMLGGMMIPSMLILLGFSLATLGITDVRAAVALAVARLAIGVASAGMVILLLGLSGVVAGAVFLLATMPAAIVTFVYADRYTQSAGRVAGGIVVSTVLTFLCLPALIWAALWLAENSLSALLGGGG